MNEPEGETVAEKEAHNARLKAYVDAVGECADAWEVYTKALDLQNALMEKFNGQLRKRISEIEAERGLK